MGWLRGAGRHRQASGRGERGGSGCPRRYGAAVPVLPSVGPMAPRGAARRRRARVAERGEVTEAASEGESGLQRSPGGAPQGGSARSRSHIAAHPALGWAESTRCRNSRGREIWGL